MKTFQTLEHSGACVSNRWKSPQPGPARRMARRAALGAALVCVWAGAASAAVRYVSSFSGVDVGGGTSATAPCKTIQYAVNQSGSGDEIRIAAYDVTSSGFPPVTTTNTCVYTGTNTAVISLGSGKSLSLKGGYIYIVTGGIWYEGIVPPVVNGENARRGLYATAGDDDTNHIELLEFVNGAAADGANV